MNQTHSFHMVFMSPWPITTGFLVLGGFLGFSLLLGKKFYSWVLIFLMISVILWWRDVSRESSDQGFHSTFVFSNMRMGMIFFIVSEILFFMSFFWGFFHSSLSPEGVLGGVWPPVKVMTINPFDVPLLNTILLLSSGITVTICHHYMINNKFLKSKMYLFYTILLGMYFTAAQGFEYWDAGFSIPDSSYSSCFFAATGFHGLHVIIGTLFLMVGFSRLSTSLMNYYHHVGVESGIWYWHFVDVIWLFLFTFIYWWAY